MCGFPLDCGQLTRHYTLRENGFFLSQQLTLANNATSKDEIMPNSYVGFVLAWACIDLVYTIITAVSSYVLLCVEDTVSLLHQAIYFLSKLL